jgi:hypothetical protein
MENEMRKQMLGPSKRLSHQQGTVDPVA